MRVLACKCTTMLTTHPKHFPVNSSDISSVNGKVIEIKDNTGIGDKNGLHPDARGNG